MSHSMDVSLRVHRVYLMPAALAALTTTMIWLPPLYSLLAPHPPRPYGILHPFTHLISTFTLERSPTTIASPFDGAPLAGTGCRYKFGFVKIYALGLYCDTAAAGVSTADKEEVWTKLMDDSVPKTISLKIVYTLKPQQASTNEPRSHANRFIFAH